MEPAYSNGWKLILQQITNMLDIRTVKKFQLLKLVNAKNSYMFFGRKNIFDLDNDSKFDLPKGSFLYTLSDCILVKEYFYKNREVLFGFSCISERGIGYYYRQFDHAIDTRFELVE